MLPVRIPLVNLSKQYLISSKGDVFDEDGHTIIGKYVSHNGFNYVPLLVDTKGIAMFNVDIIIGYTFLSEERKKLGLCACDVIHKNGNTFDDSSNNIQWVVRTERWDVICDPDIVEDTYLISSFGRVKNVSTDKEVACFCSKGYKYVTLRNKNGSYSQRGVNRLVAASFVKGFSAWRSIVNHIDGNRGNNYWRNLEWCTFSENTKHAHLIQLINSPKGEAVHSHKINKTIAKTIWLLLIDDVDTLNGREPTHGSPKKVVEYLNEMGILNVNAHIVDTIKRKRAWAHVIEDINRGDNNV